MAKKKKTARRPRAAQAEVLELPCSFGGVSFGKKTVRVGVSVEREFLSLSKADENLCDRRLTLTIHANGNGDQKGQGRLEGMEDDLDITGSADVKGFGVHTTAIGFGLTFNKNEMKKLAQKTNVSIDDFAAREGQITIAEIEDIPEEEKGEDAESGEAEEGGGDGE